MSRAVGVVGTIVGQIAKINGDRAVGIAGGPEKCRMLVEELGFESAIDYKARDLKRQLREQLPAGADVFLDNVGGEILDAGLTRLARNARVVICGAVSQYNNATPVAGPSNYLSLLVNRASMSGFVVFDHADRYDEAAAQLTEWLYQGRLTSVEHIVRGDIDQFPDLLAGLFRGENTGKLVLQIRT